MVDSKLILVLVALVAVLASAPSQADFKPGQWSNFVERVRTYMENDLKGCEGEQKAISNSERLADVIMPNDKCLELCQASKLNFEHGDYKHSGSTVLCCCKKGA